jgi:hypothetical protein
VPRAASGIALKQAKRVFRFLQNVAYNLKLVFLLASLRLRVDMRKRSQISLVCRFVWITGIRWQGVKFDHGTMVATMMRRNYPLHTGKWKHYGT